MLKKKLEPDCLEGTKTQMFDFKSSSPKFLGTFMLDVIKIGWNSIKRENQKTQKFFQEN